MANAQLRYRYIENTRGNPSLIFDDYRFRVISRRDDRIYWRCIAPSCQARIATLNNIPVKPNPLHNHQPDPIKNRVLETMNEIKKRCREDTQPVPQIYTTEIAKMRTSTTDTTTDTTVSQLPHTNPATTLSIGNAPNFYLVYQPVSRNSACRENGQQLQLETNSYSPMIALTNAYSSSLLRPIFNTYATQKSSTQMVLSTRAPIFYPDLLHPCGRQRRDVPGKSQQLYVRFYQLLKSACQANNLVLRPQTLFMDFETAAQNAAKVVFPHIQIKGCFFHYTQCIWRKTQATGLQIAYREDADVKTLVRRAAVLPLVPPSQVDDVWFNALEDIDDSDSLADTSAFNDYVTSQWIEHDRPDIWNHFNTDGPRTTNYLEGWHSKMKRLVQTAHPNIYVMINHLKTIQASNEVNILQVAAGGVPRPKRRKYRHIDSRLKLLKQRLLSGSMTLMDYADAASLLLHLG